MADTIRMQDGAKNDSYEVNNMTACENESTEVKTCQHLDIEKPSTNKGGVYRKVLRVRHWIRWKLRC